MLAGRGDRLSVEPYDYIVEPWAAEMGELVALTREEVLPELFFLANEDCLLVTFTP